MATTDKRSLLEIAQQYALPGLPVDVRIEGVPPGFLMHAAESMVLNTEAAEAHRAGGKRTKFIPSPEEEAAWGRYAFDDGTLYLPARSILRALIEAAKAFKIPKSRASMRTAVAAGVTVPQSVVEGFPLLDPVKNKPIVEYHIDRQRAVVQRAAIMRSRPRVDEWAAEATFLLDVEAVPPQTFAEILGYAGSRIGVGDNRPEKGGQNGRFVITKLDVVG